MIGILGGMGTQAGLDFCNKLAMLNRGKLTKNIHYSFYIINQIYLEDLNRLALMQKLHLGYLENQKIYINIIKS